MYFQVFKGVIDPKHVAIEALNQQVEEMTRDCTAEQAIVIREPVVSVNQRWDTLQTNIGNRQVCSLFSFSFQGGCVVSWLDIHLRCWRSWVQIHLEVAGIVFSFFFSWFFFSFISDQTDNCFHADIEEEQFGFLSRR